jgi:protoporphyrinogen/coproporphyrinogen III oxidase
MAATQATPRRVAVIGGGIAGLAAAHRLVELDPGCELTLFEAAPRLGGVISTVHEEGFQVEQSADNFITTVPWGVDLCKRLGLGDQLLGTNLAYRRTFIVRRGRLYRLPDGFLMMAPTRLWPLALTPLLSPLGKFRAALEYFIPPRGGDADESMAQFVRRRLGREAFDRLVEPLVSAVYAADLEKLSVLATLSRFREMERDFGSLIRAMRHAMKSRPDSAHESGARYSMFVTLRGGLTSLVESIASRLPPGTVQLNMPVTRIDRIKDQWCVITERGKGEGGRGKGDTAGLPSPFGRGAGGEGDEQSTNHRALTLTLSQRERGPDSGPSSSSASPFRLPPSPFDAIILATPSPVTAKLLQPLDASLAADLASIEHSGVAVVSLGYDSAQIGHPLDGMGAVVPAVERSPILAVSFSSQKYPHRAPAGKTLLRVFAGGARRPELAAMSDAELKPLVLDELPRLLQVRGQPCYCCIARWPGTMPQYHVGHKDLVARIEGRVGSLPNLALAGNAYHGVGIPDCIHGGELAAERVLG